jgi:hypothetical protein
MRRFLALESGSARFGDLSCGPLITRTSESGVRVTRKGEAGPPRPLQSDLQDELTAAVRGVMALREREGEMANKKSGKRGSAVIALIAVLAALAGPSAAAADPGKSQSRAAYEFSYVFSFGVDASWVEE